MELKEIYGKIYKYCFYKLRNSAAAEDITQETFLRFFSQNKKIGKGEDIAYLYTVARNLCVDFFRKKQTEELTEDHFAEEFSNLSETKIAVRAALETLDEKQKEVILLRYVSELSVGETALTVGVSRFAVYRLERAALAKMKKYMEGVPQNEK